MKLALISCLLSSAQAFTTPHGAVYSATGHTTTSATSKYAGTHSILGQPRKDNTALFAKSQDKMNMLNTRAGSPDRTVELYAANTMDDAVAISQEKDAFPTSVAALGGFALVTFSGVALKLQEYLNKSTIAAGGASPSYTKFAQFFEDHEALSFLLILTHAIPFVLMPYTMKQIADKSDMIKQDHPEFNPFIMQLAMACTTFGLSLEFGWHVADSWYYDNNFHVLNFGFYFFLISSFALWADGFKSNLKMDAVFGGILLLSTILYPLGAGVECGAIQLDTLPDFLQFVEKTSIAKIPLYIGLTATFVSISVRGVEIFGKDMWKVFGLSVGVNLAFIFALANYAYDSSDPDNLSQLNYILHICHDVLGTEAGVFYFSQLVRNYQPKSLSGSA